MDSIKDLIELCKQEKSKVFVTDEKGHISLVIMSAADYKNLRNHTDSSSTVNIDPEKVNKEILAAQLQEDNSPLPPNNLPIASLPIQPPRVDLRAEVIDPNFGQAVVEVEGEESIRPQFDDI